VSIFEDMIAQVRMQKSKYDDIVIDTRGSQETNPVMYDAVQVADVVITPLRTSLFDKQTMKEMDRLIGVARSFNPALRAYILLNGVGTNAKNPRALQIRESLEALSNYNGILQTRVCQRQVFEDSAAMGLTVTEFGRDKKAAEEARAVAAEIWQ
jgi:cellulose biosynthesis protein BcsQ